LLIAHCSLLIIGSGSQLEVAQNLAKDNPRIKFLGYQPEEKIQEYFSQADYTIVPSLCYENSPTVIFESLSAGVPVIASDLGGIPELVRAGENGYLFRAGDRRELISVIQKVDKKIDKILKQSIIKA